MANSTTCNSKFAQKWLTVVHIGSFVNYLVQCGTTSVLPFMRKFANRCVAIPMVCDATYYKFTSDDIFFQVYADRNDLTKVEYKQAREQFFSKGQPCFRASPLTKTYGFGVHADSTGKVAIYRIETEQYEKFQNDPKLKKTKAMQSAKK